MPTPLNIYLVEKHRKKLARKKREKECVSKGRKATIGGWAILQIAPSPSSAPIERVELTFDIF